MGWARKLEQSKKNRCRQGIFVERGLFAFFNNKDTENLKRDSQNQKNLVDDLRSSDIT